MGFSQPSIPQSTSYNLSPAQSAYQSTASNWLSGQVGQNAPPYPGQLTAPLSPQQGQSIGQLGTVGQAAAAPTMTGLNTLGNMAGGGYLYDPFTAGLMKSTADYANTLYQQNQQNIMSPFIQAGQTGASSPMISALNQGNAQFTTGLANTLAQQAEGAYQQGLGQMQQAAQSVVPLGLSAGTTGLTALGAPQQTEQAALSSNYQDYLRQIQQPWQAVSAVPGLLSQVQSISQPPLYGPSPFQEFTGGLSSMLGPFAMLKFMGLF